MAETCHEEDATQLIPYVDVTRRRRGRATPMSVPVVDRLAERKPTVDELFADTAYEVDAAIPSKPRARERIDWLHHRPGRRRGTPLKGG